VPREASGQRSAVCVQRRFVLARRSPPASADAIRERGRLAARPRWPTATRGRLRAREALPAPFHGLERASAVPPAAIRTAVTITARAASTRAFRGSRGGRVRIFHRKINPDTGPPSRSARRRRSIRGVVGAEGEWARAPPPGARPAAPSSPRHRRLRPSWWRPPPPRPGLRPLDESTDDRPLVARGEGRPDGARAPPARGRGRRRSNAVLRPENEKSRPGNRATGNSYASGFSVAGQPVDRRTAG